MRWAGGRGVARGGDGGDGGGGSSGGEGARAATSQGCNDTQQNEGQAAGSTVEEGGAGGAGGDEEAVYTGQVAVSNARKGPPPPPRELAIDAAVDACRHLPRPPRASAGSEIGGDQGRGREGEGGRAVTAGAAAGGGGGKVGPGGEGEKVEVHSTARGSAAGIKDGRAEVFEDWWHVEFVGEGRCVFGDGSR
jgi:hypothetical protein